MDFFLTCLLEELEKMGKVSRFASVFCISLKQKILERRGKYIIPVVDFFSTKKPNDMLTKL